MPRLVQTRLDLKAEQPLIVRLNCGKAQGYYFSKPMAWSDAAKLISREGGAP